METPWPESRLIYGQNLVRFTIFDKKKTMFDQTLNEFEIVTQSSKSDFSIEFRCVVDVLEKFFIVFELSPCLIVLFRLSTKKKYSKF